MHAGRVSQTADLRAAVQRFIRGFGVLQDAQTPCGKPMHTSHAHTLMILLATDGEGLHQAELGRQLGIDKSNASRLVAQLAAKGHVSVTAVAEDARIKRVRLTAKGTRVAASVDAASRQRFADLLAGIAPRRRKTVLAGLSYLTQALERP
jgi:DNA-binding MarR family transcriptional regulator